MSDKSAKDIAFDKERSKYKKEIACLNAIIKNKDKDIDQLHSINDQLNDTINQKNDYIERLLEYTEMDLDDLKLLINAERKKKELHDRARTINCMCGALDLHNSFSNLLNLGLGFTK